MTTIIIIILTLIFGGGPVEVTGSLPVNCTAGKTYVIDPAHEHPVKIGYDLLLCGITEHPVAVTLPGRWRPL